MELCGVQDGLHVAPERSVESCAHFVNNWPDIDAHNGERQLFAGEILLFLHCEAVILK